MKTTITNSILVPMMVLLMTVSCKNQDNKDIAMVDDQAVMELPNSSDSHFEIALNNLNMGNNMKAAEELNMAKQGLIDESSKGQLTLKGKDQLDNAVYNIDSIIKDLKNGKEVDENELKEAIINAEMVVKHTYLISEDVYILSTEKDKEDQEVTDTFKTNMQALQKFNQDLEQDGTIQAEVLLTEGQTLNEEYDQWIEKVNTHNGKTSDFLEGEIFTENLPLR